MSVRANCGRKPSLNPDQVKDVLELAQARIDAELRIAMLESNIDEMKQDIRDLKDRKAALTNTQIGKLFGVSHNVVRDVLLGNYRWCQVDAGHENENAEEIK